MARPRFVADAPDAVRSVELEGLTALYHRPSGMTHILAPPAPQILDAIGGSPADAAEILKRIGERFDLASGEDAEAAIEARLAELEAAGLVRRL
ncbi:MAG: HPr-rel-A system PqqD family peptide chaperone [Alphaproteobacteria bacterium]|nr:MAG: HPr-rel-A system PqqD family peptide chaperone [Alphaproteobacteria bacterium]